MTSRDIQEIVTKLSSDKAKTREDGIKLLNSWLEGDRSIGFCRYLCEKSSAVKPTEIPHSETWSFIVKILIQCITLEISSSKKRLPKLTFAKTLRAVVQRAEDDKFSSVCIHGKRLLLLPVVRLIYSHVGDVIQDVPSYQSEYGVILRLLLSNKDYRFHMRKKVYSNLVLLYMQKVETSLSSESIGQLNPKEEVFRFTLTLQSLLENPPGDTYDDIRDDIVNGFVKIFSHIRDEGKISRKLIECINTYLSKDGPNLGFKSIEIHGAVQQFVFRCWFSTRDRCLKDALIFYARLQVSLTRGVADGNDFLEQILDVIIKELDQMNTSCANIQRADSIRDEKSLLLTSSQRGVVELAAFVICRACNYAPKTSSSGKRSRREHMTVLIKERLMEGKWSWSAVILILARKYSTRVKKDLFVYWFDSIATNFERIINNANMDRSYDGLLWTLWFLLRFSSLLLDTSSGSEPTMKYSFPKIEVEQGWRTVWSSLIRALPSYVNNTSIVDAALMLLCNIMLNDSKDSFFTSPEIWNLRVFKSLPSISVLCFITCSFSRRASQADSRDALHLRREILQAVLSLLNSKECSSLNERSVVMVPDAAYSLCTGCAPLIEALGLSSSVYGDGFDEQEVFEGNIEIFECSVEVLAKIDHDSARQVYSPENHQRLRLPRQLRGQLLNEMETYVLECIRDKEIEKMLLSEVINFCALLSNIMYCSYSTRIKEDVPPFFEKLGEVVSQFLERAIAVIEKTYNGILSGDLESESFLNNLGLNLASFNNFSHSPLFTKWLDKDAAAAGLLSGMIKSSERLLKSLAKLYGSCSMSRKIVNPKQSVLDSLEIHTVEDYGPTNRSKNLILDMELDMNSGPGEIDSLTIDNDQSSAIPITMVNQKLDLLSIMSSFFSILPSVTWKTFFDIKRKETDPKISEKILCSLCQNPHWSSCSELLELVLDLTDSYNLEENLKIQCSHVLDGINSLVNWLLHLDGALKHESESSSGEKVPDKCLISLGDLVNKVSESGFLDWHDRSKLVECISNFILLSPPIAQSMIEKLFMLLRDPDYRVRFRLSSRIGVLFQTWDGHVELFQDICSNFGAKLVTFSSEKITRAEEVLADGPRPSPVMETIIITLMHIVLQSEKLELQAAFMICVVAAINFDLRELVGALLDGLAIERGYLNRAKYMEQLMGPLLFAWVECGVSLAALVETRDLYVSSAEPSNFVQYCCQWLLPALILHDDSSNLQWIAKVSYKPCEDLVKDHFVHIFSVCMALHCSKKAGWDRGSRVLGSSLLNIGKISEQERDELIKKRMVSIANYTLSLASSASDPPLPLFSKDTIVCAIRTVVDGFLDSEDHSRTINLVDKIHVFRPDRVFMFIVDMHYKVNAAAFCWHQRNHFAGIEVLVNLLGDRAAVPSTSCYLLNMVGQFIDNSVLMDQCCSIISTLLKIPRSAESTRLLGEQLQYLVGKLVTCCSPPETCGKHSASTSPQAITLLKELTIASDSSMHEYIKELEPFPQHYIFDDIRIFHHKISEDYSARSHLLDFVKRSKFVPPRLLHSSLKALHENIFTRRKHLGKKVYDENVLKDAYWNSDDEIVHAAWNLVQICSLNDKNDLGALVADFISMVGIGDPHRVVFHLPGELHTGISGIVKSVNVADPMIHFDTGVSNEILLVLMRLLKKYLMDDSVEMIDKASQALRGILSTEKGQQSLLQLDSYERSLVEVHSKGVNLELVQNLIANLQRKSDREISLEDSTLWSTSDKMFGEWICPLVYAMISYCDDLIIRLCQDIVLAKSEIAELLFSNVIVNIAGRDDLTVDLCRVISSKVQEYVFSESNTLIKSIQIFLNALNDLRWCHVVERTKSSATPHKQKTLKHAKVPASGSKLRAVPVKTKNPGTSSSGLIASPLIWEKVYWLAVDYLVVAKSAIDCGSYFTAFLYVEHWCEDNFSALTLGAPDFSIHETLPRHIEILLSAVTQINEPDSLYGVIQSHKLTSQILTFEHEGNWSKALEFYDMEVRSQPLVPMDGREQDMINKKSIKGLIRSLQQTGCSHVLDLYCQGLTAHSGRLQHDLEFSELQYEAAWRCGNWDFCPLYSGSDPKISYKCMDGLHFNENLHGCFRALHEGEFDEFHRTLKDSKKALLTSIYHSSKESTQYIYSTMVKLQILHHLGMSWGLRWSLSSKKFNSSSERQILLSEPVVPSTEQLQWLRVNWNSVLKQTELHMNLLEPFIAFRRVLLGVLNSVNSTLQHLLESASILRKGSRISQAAAALHEFKILCSGKGGDYSNLYWLGRLEEAKLLRAQGQHQMAIHLADHVSQNHDKKEDTPDVYRLVGKWLAETRSSNSGTILEKYLKHAVNLADHNKDIDSSSMEQRNKMHFHLAHYADALFHSHEERISSSEWQVAMRLRKHKTRELEALIKRFKSTPKGDKTDYSLKIQELQKQLSMDREEEEKLQEDRDNFLHTALEGYTQCLVIGEKYDVRVVFRLVSLWFSLSVRQIVVDSMLCTIKEVQSYKFIPLVYQIASRMGGPKDSSSPSSFQFALRALLKKMSIDHPYHTIFQLLALANGDRIKDKQRSRNSFVVDIDKKEAAEDLLRELSSYHGPIIRQMKQMVEIYIKLAEMEIKREDTNKRVTLPRDVRSVRNLELVPVVTSNFSVDRSCQYPEGSFPYFRGLADSVTIMNGINAPKVVECLGSDGTRYRQLAKSGNDDLRQDAVMEQFFGLVNTFLQNNRITRQRKLRIRTYKVVPFTPSAGVLEWVNGTFPLGEYLIGSSRNGGAHGRYGVGDWTFMECRQHMTAETNKRKAFQEVCDNFRPVMHNFFLERFSHPADWFEKRLAYTRSVAASSMVGYIVGLGDRHSMNILIDQVSAEVVHIDLGVAFEQGLMLKTPERVPFRLTRDIIDGMGVTGVEGVFRRCCEETLSVMRTNKEALLTIIEVFIHDPLYKWALSPLKAMQRQKDTDYELDANLEDSDEDEYEGNKDATRALLRVKQKLDGYEDGEMRSVHGQVQQLIQDAIDPDRLCQMFPGWGAWL